jgi:hypothetical protein
MAFGTPIDTELLLFLLLVSLPRLASLRVVSCRVLSCARSRSYVAAKSYYFSVGGGCRQFEEMVNRDGLLETSVEKVIKGAYHHHHHCARCFLTRLLRLQPINQPDGSSNVREIIKVSFKKQDP